MLYQHWRPVLDQNAKNNTTTVEDPHAQPSRSAVSSWARICILVSIWRLSFWGHLKKVRAAGKLIIFDRFYGDLLVDPKRYRYGGGRWFSSCAFKLMPKPNLVILLNARAEVLYARKPEVEIEELKRIVARYQKYVSSLKNGLVIDAEQSVEDVVKDVQSAVQNIL